MTDASYKLVGARLRDIISGHNGAPYPSPTLSGSATEHADVILKKFHHFHTPTLPHLLALLTHHTTSFPPSGTSLIVVDPISTLFALAFPKGAENVDVQQTPVKKSEAAQWASGRRWAVMSDLISKLGRLAAIHNLAILLTSQTTTKIRSETGAVLHPAISSTAWDAGIGNRIVLFRDWMFHVTGQPSSQGEYILGVRFAGVVKAKGVTYEGVGRVTLFTIDKVRHRVSSRYCHTVAHHHASTDSRSSNERTRMSSGMRHPSSQPYH